MTEQMTATTSHARAEAYAKERFGFKRILQSEEDERLRMFLEVTNAHMAGQRETQQASRTGDVLAAYAEGQQASATEIARLKERCGLYQQKWGEEAGRNVDLEARVAELVTALRRLEWGGFNSYQCPACQTPEALNEGHAKDCWLAAVLADQEKERAHDPA